MRFTRHQVWQVRTGPAQLPLIGDEMERRRTARYVLRVPVLFNWRNQQPRQLGGFTRDVSAGGAYILCREECPSAGAPVRLQVMLPPVDAEAHGVKLESEGRVVRAHGPGEESGFAVMADFAAHSSIRKASGSD
jgi:PilZ domain